MSELFWRDPDFDRLGDIEQRIANVLKGKPREGMTPDALSPEATQLFDDLYNFATC